MTTPSRDDIIRMSKQAGWSGLYSTFNEPTGKADWKMVKESLTVPVTIEQVESFFHAAYAAGAEAMRERCAKVADYNGMPRISSIIHNINPASTSPHNVAKGD